MTHGQINKITRILILGLIFVFCYFLFIVLSSALTPAADYSVNDLGDGQDNLAGDGICATAEGVCTLRAAIQEANATIGAEVIDFAGIDTTTQQTIGVISDLPNINEQVTITAEEQWEVAGNRPGIILTTSAGATKGFSIADSADGTRISGLKIQGFSQYGIYTAAENGLLGMDCIGSPDANQRNVVVGNLVAGIYLGQADNNIIAGNWIGLDDDGTTSSPNGGGTLTHAYVDLNLNSSDNNVIGYEDGDDFPAFVCTAEQARNVIGVGAYNAINIENSSTKNKFSGNYVNVLPDGSNSVAYSARWGVFLFEASYNWIGTDGDGSNDDLEGNVFGPFALGGVYGNSNGATFSGNRISGNIFGGDPTGTSDLYTGGNAEVGIRLSNDAQNHIIGFCDNNEDGLIGDVDMCSNGGIVADQANYFIGLAGTTGGTSNGVILSIWKNNTNNYVYGNYFGVGTDSSAIGNHYGISLFYNLFGTGNYFTVGDQGDRANIFMNNQVGVNIENSTADAALMQYVKVQYNTISENISHGVQVVRGKQAQTVDSAHDILIENNTITDNGGSGVYLSGSTADIINNTITGNTEYGIYAVSTYDNLVSTYGKQTALGVASDLVPEPFNIGGSGLENTISGNLLGGIYFMDTEPSDPETLYTNNIFADNNSGPAIRTAWWGAVELLDTSLDPVILGSHTITLTPDTGSASTGAVADTGEFVGENDTESAWGSDGFDYDDQTTWFTLVDYEYATDGILTNYNPYTISVSGDNANDDVVASFIFDGSGSDISQGGLPVGISTGSGIYRYQIAEAVVSSIPDQPINLLPNNGKINEVTVPTLSTSAFSDSSETHSSTAWRVYSSEALCQAGGTGDFYDSGFISDLTSHQVTSYLLRAQDLWWSVQYKNSYGNLSTASTCTSFRIRAGSNTPVQSNTGEFLDEESLQEVMEDVEIIEVNGEDTDEITIDIEPEPQPELKEESILSFTSGKYVTNQDYSVVYYQSQDNILYPFYDLTIFFTWANKDTLITVLPNNILQTMPVASWMLPKPGVVWVKTTSSANVYTIQENSDDPFHPILRWISSESVAMNLLGSEWADYIIDIPFRLLKHFISGDVVDQTNDHQINIENLKKREELIP
ncbi:MAG: right-handed parallel beta-helix repeat-containing protein [Candidatus Uhrbacteria bacterium]